uniref:C2H2-type domain-containing protein n=2 Tax=Arion vulgaris TaxID=1028688 RepID=A0A0B7A2W1_9EUPU
MSYGSSSTKYSDSKTEDNVRLDGNKPGGQRVRPPGLYRPNDRQYLNDEILLCTQHYLAAMDLYKCSLCDVEFHDIRDLTTHRLIHMGEKPYKCDVCGSGFTRNSH